MHFSALLLLLVAIVAPTTPTAVRTGEDPAIAHLTLFLQRHGAQSGLPHGEEAARMAPSLSGRLNAAMGSARNEQNRYLRRHPDEKPPWVEGLLFVSSAYEPFTAFAIVRPEGGCRDDRCELRVDFVDDTATPAVRWHDEYVMVREGGQWRLDDVRYQAGFDFGNHGTLRESLAVHEDAPAAD